MRKRSNKKAIFTKANEFWEADHISLLGEFPPLEFRFERTTHKHMTLRHELCQQSFSNFYSHASRWWLLWMQSNNINNNDSVRSRALTFQLPRNISCEKIYLSLRRLSFIARFLRAFFDMSFMRKLKICFLWPFKDFEPTSPCERASLQSTKQRGTSLFLLMPNLNLLIFPWHFRAGRSFLTWAFCCSSFCYRPWPPRFKPKNTNTQTQKANQFVYLAQIN